MSVINRGRKRECGNCQKRIPASGVTTTTKQYAQYFLVIAFRPCGTKRFSLHYNQRRAIVTEEKQCRPRSVTRAYEDVFCVIPASIRNLRKNESGSSRPR